MPAVQGAGARRAGLSRPWHAVLLGSRPAVRKTDFQAVDDALRPLQYQRDAFSKRQEQLYTRYHFAHTYSPAAEGPDIDVHWSLFPVNFPIPVDYAGLRARSTPIDIGGIRTTTFSREDTLVYLSLHGAKEQWRRLQMIADVAAMVAAGADLDWEACWRIADQWHARRKFLLALYLASAWLGAKLPSVAAQRVESDRVVPSLLATCCADCSSSPTGERRSSNTVAGARCRSIA